MRHLKKIIFLCILTFTVSCGQQKKYIEYKVKEGETINMIANKLDITTEDLLRLNPDIGKKLAKNSVIIIPNKKEKVIKKVLKKASEEGLDTAEKLENKLTEKELQKNKLFEELEKEYKIHEVKKGDTFFSLARFYNVTKEELVALNPELSEGLKLGQIIKIMPVKDVFEEDDLLYKDEIEEGISLKVAIMLPFKATDLDTLSYRQIFRKSKLANIVTDLYLGAEIAVDSLRKQGVEINLNVYDTGANSTKIKDIVTENNLDDEDVIIGLLYSEEVTFLADRIKTPIIFPVYSKRQAEFTSEKIVKTVPNKKQFRDKLLEYIKEKFHDGNIIVVGDGKPDSNFNSKQIKELFESSDSISAVNIITPEKGYIKKTKFTDVLKPNMNNLVVMTTDDNVIVASAINSLISLPENVTVKVFTFDRVSAFNKVDNNKLAKIGFTYVSDKYTREDSFKVR
ncbi:MAG: LysM peptidoglycan-binding domain-containing protein, partial [Polaribacter sp.]